MCRILKAAITLHRISTLQINYNMRHTTVHGTLDNWFVKLFWNSAYRIRVAHMYADNLSGLENWLAPSWWQTIIWSTDNLSRCWITVNRTSGITFQRKWSLNTFESYKTFSYMEMSSKISLQWHHNGLDGVSNHQPRHCLLSRLFGRRSKKTPGTGEFPAQMASSAENISIWWRHHAVCSNGCHFVWSLYAERNVCIIEICRFLAQYGSLGSHFSEIISVCKMAAILSSPLFSQSKLCTIEICLGNYHKHKLNDRRCCQLFLRWSTFGCRSTCDSLAIQYHPSNMTYMYMQRDIINQCS